MSEWTDSEKVMEVFSSSLHWEDSSLVEIILNLSLDFQLGLQKRIKVLNLLLGCSVFIVETTFRD